MEKVINQLKKQITQTVSQEFNITAEALIEKPKDSAHGDYSTNIAMQIVKQVNQDAEKKLNPLEISNKIVEKLQGKMKEVKDISVVAPGFINFTLDDTVYSGVLTEVLEKGEGFGNGDDLKGKRILIEHTSPNPNKELHLGHLKNNTIGLSISYILESQQANLSRDCIDNNRGIAIAKLMWGYLEFAKKKSDDPTDLEYWYKNQTDWYTPEEKEIDPGKFVDQLYSKASEQAKKPEVDKLIRKLVLDWENGDEANRALWQKTQDWVWSGYEKSLNRVNGWKFDKIWHESEIYKEGKEHVERGLREGIFRKLDDGAILTNLKAFNLPDTILMKNDGTSLYITQDLELTSLKRKTFDPDIMIWMIGPEQSLAMKQMFAVCSQLGFGKYEDFIHLSYGFILVKDKNDKPTKMASREGTQIYSNELIDQAKEQIKTRINSEFKPSERESLAEKVAIAAVKYSLLKVSRTQDQIFDFGTTVAFEGDSGPYVMYTYARAKSVLQQVEKKVSPGSIKMPKDFEQEELAIIKKLAEFPQIVQKAAKDYAPNYITTFVYQLAQLFNLFYTKHKILKAEENKEFRLALTEATAIVIKKSLDLLGIEAVEKM